MVLPAGALCATLSSALPGACLPAALCPVSLLLAPRRAREGQASSRAQPVSSTGRRWHLVDAGAEESWSMSQFFKPLHKHALVLGWDCDLNCSVAKLQEQGLPQQ